MGEKLKKPPLIEAICEIEFDDGANWDHRMAVLISNRIRAMFPIARLNEEDSDQIDFYSNDENVRLIIGPQSVAINQLDRYTTWAEFLPLILFAIEAYKEIVDPTEITSVSLRYVNKINLPNDVFPGPSIDLEEVFGIYPGLKISLPDGYNSFQVGINAPFNQGSDALRVELASTRSDVLNASSFLYDLHYYSTETKDVDPELLETWLEMAHHHITEFFLQSIAERLMVTFKEPQSLHAGREKAES